MNRFFILFIAILIVKASFSQAVVDLSKFPVPQNDTTILLTADLLDKINWSSIRQLCLTSKEHHFNEQSDSLLTFYDYTQQGGITHFEIVSYREKVLLYSTYASSSNNTPYYFAKNLWLDYAEERIPGLPDSFKLTVKEPGTVLKAYYRLLGIDRQDEYGWICEYAAAGRAPGRRVDIITLLRLHRIDLIRRLFSYTDVQTKLYAADALIYHDYETRSKIKALEKEIKEKQKQSDHLQKRKEGSIKAEELDNQVKTVSDSITRLNTCVLTADEWKMIYDFRDSNQIIRTCGNAGSYRAYRTPVAELLSDKAIAGIIEYYERLKDAGYFW